jgi:hypothetical protein
MKIMSKPSHSDRLIALRDLLKDNPDYSFEHSGKRIRLLWTDDRYTELKRNDEGVIELIHKQMSIENQVWVKWDNGSNLMLLEGKDDYEIVEGVK